MLDGLGSDERATEEQLDRLLAAAVSDPVARPAFTSALLEGEVLVLGSLDPPAVDGVAQRGSSIRILETSDGQGPVTPFFTSERAVQATLAAWPGTDPGFVRLRSRDLMEMTRGKRLPLNPHGPGGKLFLAPEIESLQSGGEPGMQSEVVQEGRQVLVGSPAHVPPQLPEVLSRFLAQRPGAERAHLGWIVHPDGQSGYLLVIVADDREATMAGFGSLQIGDVTGGKTLDVLVVAPGSGDHLLSGAPPFYTRGSA